MIRDEFLALALRNPFNAAILDELHRLALPDAWLVAGCLVQTVWNVLTGRPIDHGIADYDVFYFDSDTSWEAEDAVIRKLHAQLAHLGAKVEIRNQARVHLWYSGKYGLPYPPPNARDRRDRPLPHGEYAGGHSPCRWGFRRLRAARVRRRRKADCSTQSGAEFFRRQLRGEGGTLENAVARDHGNSGGVRCRLYPPRHCEERRDEAIQTAAAEAILDCFATPATLAMTVVRAACYLTTPDVNPAFRRGGLISFFRKQRASRPV
jgi:hypothetical protein